jgi:hypothetical protein
MKRRDGMSALVLDPVLIIGTLISLALGVIFYLRRGIAPALATVAGLLGLVITLQIQAMLQDRRNAEHQSRVGAMIAAIEEISWLPGVMEPALRAASHVQREFEGTPAVNVCREAFERCLGTLVDLERGHFTTPYGDNALFLSLIQHTKRTMCGTSVPAVDLDWWLQPIGRQYWQAQIDAMAQGVTIRRVFIYQTWTGELDALAREQAAAGVAVRRIHNDRLAPNLRVITAVWDGTCGHELSYTAGGDATADSFTVSPPDLERLTRQFDTIERHAVAIDEEEPAGQPVTFY